MISIEKKRIGICGSCDKNDGGTCTDIRLPVGTIISSNRIQCEKWPDPNETVNVSVVITSHNYGCYLEEAIDSVLSQSFRPSEIIVVDDGSSDDTESVANRYSGHGVEYIRVNHRNSHKSRQSGFDASTGEFVLFLDADNYLTPEYIENGLDEFTHRNIGIVYADLQYFGKHKNHRSCFPEYSRDLLMRGNFVDACAIIRREALEVNDAFSIECDGVTTPEDYLMFQQLAKDGWDFRKQDSVLMYRTHDRQKNVRTQSKRIEAGYFSSSCLRFHDITLFIPLSGRDYAWDEQCEFLDRQAWPHDKIRLVLCDTSERPEFSDKIREWISICDYPDVRYFKFSATDRSGLESASRFERGTEREVQLAMCRIYNRMRPAIETDYCWILEDDIIPPDDVLERLLRNFNKDVGAVTAPYLSRWDSDYVVWTADRAPRGKAGVIRAKKPPLNEPQSVEVRGAGFGCIVMRSELVRNHVFAMPRGELHYDPYFFRVMGDKWKRICDWSCECDHLGPRHKRPKIDSSYWSGRKKLKYYRTASSYAKRYGRGGKTLLDVGGGVGMGCRFLEWFSGYERTAVELPSDGITLDGVQIVHEEFQTWEPDQKYDLVFCMQVLEHVPDATTFAQKLFDCGETVVISVPYRWPEGACGEHVHDPVDEDKLRSWTGREPTEMRVVDSRLVAVYA